MNDSEIQYSEHNEYKLSLKLAHDWLDTANIKLQSCAESVGNIPTISGRLRIVSEIMGRKSDGLETVNNCLHLGSMVSTKCGVPGKQSVEAEIFQLQADWNQFETDLSMAHIHLGKSQDQWNKYEAKFLSVEEMVKVNKKTLKETQSSNEEAHLQLQTYEVSCSLFSCLNIVLDFLNIEQELALC
jgi:hypothetical protein